MNPVRRFVLLSLAVVVFGIALYRLQVPLRPTGDGLRSLADAVGEVAEIYGARLPAGVEPIAYRLRFTIDPKEETFLGHVEIDVRLAKASSSLHLHGKRLNVTRARVLTPGGEAIPAHYREVGPHGDARLTLRKSAPAGAATLVLDYQAPFNEALEGAYRIQSGDAHYVFTQFQATSARLAFPAFDEPRFKTPFHVSLVIPATDEGVSNMPLAVARDAGGDRRLLVFEPTPPLPSYLLAFAVGPFDVTAGPVLPSSVLRARPVPLRALKTKDASGDADVALTSTQQLMTALERYTAQPYAFTKLDLIAAPSFAAAAMENPGAILYHDQVLLLPPSPSTAALRRLHQVHAHELAHQWFGNLVTPPWWNDLWLSESFATWLGARTLAKLRPGLDFEWVIQRGARSAMAADEAANPRRLRQSIAGQEDIDTAFDAITYEKGAAVLAMFESWVGANKFRDAVRRYLRSHIHGSATTDDFLKALSETLGEDVTAEAFRTFLEQPGVPMVSLEWNCPQQGVNIAVSQQRYARLGETAAPTTWGIPVCVRLFGADGTSKVQCMIATRPSQTFYLREEACPHGLAPNADGRGYYRWRITGPHAHRLGDMLARLNPGEVLSYADSASAAFRAGHMTVAEYLAAARRLAASAQWDAATTPLADLRFLLHHVVPPDESAQRIGRAVIADIYRARLEVGLEVGLQGGNDPGARELRRRLLDFYVRDLEDPGRMAVLADQGRRYVGYPNAAPDSDAVDADMARLAVTAALMSEGEQMADFLIRHLKDRMAAERHQVMLAALALTPRTAVAALFLNYLASAAVTPDDLHMALGLVADNPAARPLLWLWLTEHGQQAAARLPDWLKGDIVSVLDGYCDAAKAAWAPQVFTPLAVSLGAAQRLDNTVAQIKHCATLKAALQDSVHAAFGLDRGPAGGSGETEPDAPLRQIPD